MNWNTWIPLLVVLSSLVPALMIFGLPQEKRRLRIFLNLFGVFTTLFFVIWMFFGVYHGYHYEVRLPLLPDLDMVLRAGPLALLFSGLSSVLWLLTTIYAIGYLEGSTHSSRFFGFFSLCVTSTIGISLSGNLITFLIYYEMLTLSAYPLIVHRGTEESRLAGKTYLIYTLFGGALLLLSTIWLYSLAGTLEFTPRGFIDGIDEEHNFALISIFILFIAGFGVKAALFPLHGWLPMAMIAPAPVSALLHAVAVVKAGAFGIIRVVYEVFGIEKAALLGLTQPLAMLASVTIIYGSLRALFQDDLKRRLAFSTVSQVSYIILGVAIVGPIATVGGVVHLVHQGLMKITLFFCAGILAETLGIHKISEMNGVARRMPWTMAAFSIGALGMIGVPPIVGFVSKWYLGLGALEAGEQWVIVVLVGSSLLNAGYFLPILYRAWFLSAPTSWPHEDHFGRKETKLTLLLPPLVTAVLALLFGLFAASPFSPLEWVELIAKREFY
ncbi:complex I subunit 5 family protein [Candidatus Sulfurimonas baltica]|uniref:Monovalent cation/H+ antiporter subunit D family protein n=1 Tax=Candidatus Sulfurimonas baltica TaxID=2740404 RepID=A0A7S7LZ15_9BACT|nr:proton-conducting transporter membrane subunit [Candidatus Sulfurimonas baltica]QOY53179.1 monovalent cation/H+ antiporter subunit D family protein [Candidatus Sulfurimonas baltica]